MKTTEVEFAYPVLGFTTDKDVWGFPDLERLTKCGPRTLKDKLQDQMELMDARGRRWQVRSVQSLGRAKPALGAWLRSLLTGVPQFRIEHDLDMLAPLTLQQVQARVCESIEAHPLFWCEPGEEDTVLPARMAEVRSTPSISEIHDVLGLDTFEAY